MQVYLGDKALDFRGIQLGTTNITTVTMPKFLNVDVLVVGGGGGAYDGGGGAGGYYTASLTITSNEYSVIVGAGGSGSIPNIQNGQNSSISFPSASIAYGGGAGGGGAVSPKIGGSGGGGGYQLQPGAAGIIPQGSYGGPGSFEGDGGGGGGGGAAQSGGNGFGNGYGGAGKQWLDGNYYAGGGGGGTTKVNQPNFVGGIGGGGTGGNLLYPASNGTPNTGGGAGGYWSGGAGGAPGNGGSGIVIIRYLGGQQAFGGTITQNGGYTYHKFTNVGTSSFTVPEDSL